MSLAYSDSPESEFSLNSANRNGPSEGFYHLLAGLFEELVNSALLVATTASIANWMIKHEDQATRHNLICYLPPTPALFQQSLLKLCFCPATQDVTSTLREYYDRLDFLRSLTTHFTGLGKEDDNIQIEVVTDSWQELALAGKAALTTLVDHLADQSIKTSHVRYQKVLSLLSDVALGHHPCVTSAGVVSVPFWADRRALRRRQTNLEAYIVVGSRIEKVAVLNASEHGIGVLGLTSVTAGDAIDLLVRPGFSIKGRVAWIKAERAGIMLEAPLPTESSLYALIH